VGLPEREGLLVRGVEDGSLADKAGIQAGDLIIAAAGKPVTDADALFETLSAAKLPFEVKVVRGTEERTVSVGGGTVSGEA
jgi:serine protease Do